MVEQSTQLFKYPAQYFANHSLLRHIDNSFIHEFVKQLSGVNTSRLSLSHPQFWARGMAETLELP
jgi:hypothetical protein